MNRENLMQTYHEIGGVLRLLEVIRKETRYLDNGIRSYVINSVKVAEENLRSARTLLYQCERTGSDIEVPQSE